MRIPAVLMHYHGPGEGDGEESSNGLGDSDTNPDSGPNDDMGSDGTGDTPSSDDS